jgi:hypothetical protein
MTIENNKIKFTIVKIEDIPIDTESNNIINPEICYTCLSRSPGDNVFYKDSLIIYFDSGRNQIIRYDISEKKFIDKVDLNKYSSKIFFDKNKNTIYLTYKSGKITKVDFTKKNIYEEDFINVGSFINNIIIMNNNLIVRSKYQFIFDLEGNLISTDDKYDENILEWDSLRDKFYYISDNNIYVKSIDKKTGITIENKLLISNATYINSFLLSKNLEKILFGKNIYNLETLLLEKEIDSNDQPSHYLDKNIMFLSNRVYNSNFEIIDTLNYEGYILKIFKHEDIFIIITYDFRKDKIEFNEYTPK